MQCQNSRFWRKSFFANNFFSLKDKGKLLTPSCFSLQDESKHVCGDLERSISKSWPQVKGHVMTRIGHVAYQSMRLDETNTLVPFHASNHPYQKLLTKKRFVTSDDVIWPFSVNWSKIVSRSASLASDAIILNEFDSSRCVSSKNEAYKFSPIDL